MRKLLLILLILTVYIFSKEIVEVYAKTVLADGKSFIAKDSVVVLYNHSMIKADKATYDRNSSLLVLEGKVEMINAENDVLASNKLVINTKDKSVKVEKIFLGGEENLWMDASGADKFKDKYVLHNSKISSCDVANPDWTIEFERADYYKDKEFVTMKDAKVRFYDTTILYVPYLAFPTLTKRTTGLLYPRFQISKREGFLYEQPFFYVPAENWDVELDPQIRSTRGAGGYVTTRFVDSNHSSGYFRTGYFRNFDEYANSNNLNKEHMGAELFYQSKDILSYDRGYLSGFNSGFYFNGTYLNDREYLNLQKSSVSALVSSNLIESRLNSFVYDNQDYYAMYGRYNIDISQENNNHTIQNFPSFHYHHYMDRIMKSKIFYTADVRLDNYSRVKGSQASQAQVDLPITYYDSLFDDYLNFSISENLYLSRVRFRNLEVNNDSYYYYYRNYHTIELSTDLTKQYKNSWHTIHPSITYILPSIEKESVEYDALSDEKKELFVTETQEEQLSFTLSQYYQNNFSHIKFFHTMGYSHYPNRIESKGDLINEIGYSDSDFNIYNNLKYAWNEQEIHSITSRIGYNQSNYDIMLTHFYNNDFLFNDKKTSFIQAEFDLHYQDKNSWFAKVDYDLEQGYNHEWKLGLRHKQKCWSGVVSVGQEVVPNVDNSFRNTALYFELNLNPIGGIQQSIEDDFSSQGANN